jgi:hypothetical protein
MIKFIFAFSLFCASSAFAAPSSELIKATLEAQPRCGTFVRYDDLNLYLGFGYYLNGVEEPRLPIPAKFQVVPFNGEPSFELNTLDGAMDLVTEGNTAFVLTYSGLEEWDLKEKVRVQNYQTYAIQGPLRRKQHAQAFARWNDKVIIAHGRLGVSFFDLKRKRLTNQFRLLNNQLPLESIAVGVTVQGNRAYVVMDNFSLVSQGKPPFRGVIVIDMASESVISETDGLDPGAASIVSDQRNVLVSFLGGPIWKYSLSDLGSMEPVLRVWRYPVMGNPIGSPSIDSKYYYTCFSKAPVYPGENGGWYRKVPMALDRRVLMLD